MYYKEDKEQIGIEEFFLPFGGKLKKNNRWVKVAEIMPSASSTFHGSVRLLLWSLRIIKKQKQIISSSCNF
jgi:hypothetical protein